MSRPSPAWRQAAGRGNAAPGELAKLIDHTILKAEAKPADVVRLCEEAAKYGFGAVCVNSVQVPLAVATLEGLGARAPAEELANDAVAGGLGPGRAGKTAKTRVGVCSVVGFPLGAMASEAKAYEAAWAVGHGADEIDMVLSVGHLKAGDHRAVENDIAAVVSEAKEAGRDRPTPPVVKVIIEACYLTDEEKARACRLAAKAGADYVKTSTGFGSGGATVADVALMRATVGEKLGVKAAGGIRDLASALAMIAAGADRLGMSAGVAVIEQARGARG